MGGFTPVIVLCDKSKGPQSFDLELINSKIIPNDSHITELKPLQKVGFEEGEIFSSVGFKEADDPAVRVHGGRVQIQDSLLELEAHPP